MPSTTTARRSSDRRRRSHIQANSMPTSFRGAGERRPRSRRVSIAAALLFLAGAAAAVMLASQMWRVSFKSVLETSAEPAVFGIDVIREYPHDPEAFTQGLLYAGNNTLYESTGLYGKSSVREVHLQTGKVIAKHQMDPNIFGEGLTLLGQRLYQVTWLQKIGFIYDRHNLKQHETFSHEMLDGWGLATNGEVLYGSDGSSTLYHIDPQTLKVRKKVSVIYNNHEVRFLNELEYINSEVWANVWQTDCIARISPEDGLVVGWILLHELRQGLLKLGHTSIDVLNGIAWDMERNRLFVTGKLWPKLYEIKLRALDQRLETSGENVCHIRF